MRLALAHAVSAACVVFIDPIVHAAPLLQSAQVTVTISTPVACEVAMILAVQGAASPVDHRLEADVNTQVDDIEIEGAEQIDAVTAIGRTRSLRLSPRQPSYSIRYRVRQADDRRNRCPLWLPSVPADGISRAVRIQVQLPSGTSPGASMPTFSWNGTQGITTLGHLPAFVLLSYRAAGESAGWDVLRIVDAAAVAVFAVATGIWLHRKRLAVRREHASGR
jgi:hypothetical protein